MLFEHIRNYGCRLNVNFFYKDLRVAVLENEYLRISVLIDKGTDIFEFLYKPKDIDFMWLSPWGIKSPSKFITTISSELGNFFDYYEGGWFEAFPNFGHQTKYKETELGFHGEICLLSWDYQIIEDNSSIISIKFSIRTVRTPFLIEKIFTLKKEDPKLYISEKIKNEGYATINFIWNQHPTFGGIFLDESIIIDIPDNRINFVSKPENLINKTINEKWPIIEGYTGKKIDFSKSPLLEDENQGIDQICLSNLKDSWYAITNLNKNTGFGMRWDNKIFPYIWIMRSYGKGNKIAPWWGRINCMAVELLSSFAPNGLGEAIKNGTAISLEPLEEISTSFIAVAFEKENNVKKIDKGGNIF
ncbi:MAG: hypothetical protein M1308_16330 [Actinobacteria bacterium]|nr:hypothetical protein [Actinomycetota bacterium]